MFRYARSLACLPLLVAACSSPGDAPGATCGDGPALHVGFYAFFAHAALEMDCHPQYRIELMASAGERSR